jgi:hypothetical protein
MADLVPEGSARDAEALGGLIAVAVGAAELGGNDVALKVVAEVFERRLRPALQERVGVAGTAARDVQHRARLTDVCGQSRGQQHVTLHVEKCLAEDMLELANVSRPIVGFQQEHGFGADGGERAGHLVAETPEKMIDEQAQVGEALTQGCDAELMNGTTLRSGTWM